MAKRKAQHQQEEAAVVKGVDAKRPRLQRLQVTVGVAGPGRAAVFGSGECAQLGLGDALIERKFAMFVGRGTPLFDDGVDVVAACAGGVHNAVVARSGAVYTWGCNDEAALGRAGDEWRAGVVCGGGLDRVVVVKVSCGDSHTAALSVCGRVFAWGAYRDDRGCMGFGTSSRRRGGDVDGPAKAPQQMALPDRRRRAVDIASGVNHTLVLDDAANVFEWGHVRLGQRVVSRAGLLRPRLVNVRRFGRVVAVFAGHYHSWALTAADAVFAWGLNQYGQAGVGDASAQLHRPTELLRLRGGGVVKLAGGLHHSLALTRDGAVYSFGRNNYGELGHGDLDERREPERVAGVADAVDIACGTSHSLVVDTAGKAYSAGFGTMLQLGSGDVEDRLTFQPVLGKMFDTYVATAVDAGAQHSLVIAQKRADAPE